MTWRIEFARSALRELDRLDPQVARRILGFLHHRLAQREDPRSIGDPLRGGRFGSFWKYRVGDWRVIASIEDEPGRILIMRIGNRRQVYRST